ncbi:hypothetical protein HZC34_08200 [Candidatus Saganbacteria bacterium]|nr:hypothetical protein [Candidatus Saganbacteria bacterium]
MQKLSTGQKKMLATFFVNGAVAWLSAGIITPFFISKKFGEFIAFGFWGLLLALFFLVVSLGITKGVQS